MMNIRHGTYVGPIEHLKGKTARVQINFGPTTVLAQFDDYENPPPATLGFNWHQFHPWEFELDEKEES